ncbi:helix-turn-helix transcriptional regulator [Clostridium botulinum]|uniref:helix-turn-helix transcriptional regulator n=1 Tax=Clostridium botulinum TaxID=1491 RepID=UPI0007743913|nr:helix-turn-helix transcriptional regulator [Clostridium botulinum]APH20947.1 helix-turn-helix family protein [Clostridium botulinum]APQ71264.1 helix-turn-helix family protein [Clostridium botulinum]MBN3379225.1 transcriptional regulator [Clostridium botulinum]
MNNKGNKIKEQRKNLCYSTKELAKISHIPEKSIINYESNKIKAKLITIRKIAKATNTKVGDWVDKEYFEQTKENYNKNLEKCIEKESIPPMTNDEERKVAFLRGMYRADEVMDILYTVLIDMNEIKRTEDKKDVIFSEFAKNLLINVSIIKLKRVYSRCNFNKEMEQKNPILNKKNNKKKLSIEDITYADLADEFQVMFKYTDTFKVIIQALNKMDAIDKEGNCTSKGKLLLDKVVENKIKKTIT